MTSWSICCKTTMRESLKWWRMQYWPLTLPSTLGELYLHYSRGILILFKHHSPANSGHCSPANTEHYSPANTWHCSPANAGHIAVLLVISIAVLLVLGTAVLLVPGIAVLLSTWCGLPVSDYECPSYNLWGRYRGEFFNLVDSGQFNWNLEAHRDLLR